ncbi:MAG: hypothetical protein ACFFDN_41020 [Candidatus Hodarchaeota archaeon]
MEKDNDLKNIDLSKRGTAKYFSTKKIGMILVTRLYPTVLSYYQRKLGTEKTVQVLRDLGSYLTDDFFKIYKKKRKNLQDYIKDWFKIFYDSKVDIKKINDKLYHVIDRDCILCMDIVLEGLPFHYCTPYGGSIERLLNVLAEQGKIPKFKYKVETIASKGHGNPYCTHTISLEE